jgi:hypothetical protein
MTLWLLIVIGNVSDQEEIESEWRAEEKRKRETEYHSPAQKDIGVQPSTREEGGIQGGKHPEKKKLS